MAVQVVVAADPALERNHTLMLNIPGIGPVTAATMLAEVPNIAEFTPKALADLAGLSPQEHSSGTSIRQPARISRMGSERLRRALYMCSLSSRRRNPALTGFVQRMVAVGKPPKVILLAIARKFLVFAHEILRTQKPFALVASLSGFLTNRVSQRLFANDRFSRKSACSPCTIAQPIHEQRDQPTCLGRVAVARRHAQASDCAQKVVRLDVAAHLS